MTELNEKQKILVIKAILDEEINMYHKGADRDNAFIKVRADSLITLREKLKILKEFQ